MASRPEKLTGGCLCGSIRYTITITPETEWPPTHVRYLLGTYHNHMISVSNIPVQNGTCQCTMCRKFTGSLFQSSNHFPTTSISPPLSSFPKYTTYTSSDKAYRGFCSKCGSSLTFNFLDDDKTEVCLGSVDEEILRGKWGTQLCKAKEHIWCENAVRGVTDTLGGVMWTKARGSEKFGVEGD